MFLWCGGPSRLIRTGPPQLFDGCPLGILPFVQIQWWSETFDQRPLRIPDAVLEDNEAVLQMLDHPIGQSLFAVASKAKAGHVLRGLSRAARDGGQSTLLLQNCP